MTKSIDVSSLSSAELKSLIRAAEVRRAQIEKRAPVKAVRKQILAYAAKEGYSIHELFGIGSDTPAPVAKSGRGPSRMKGVKLPVLYRHPEDKRLGWTGRGMKPRWLAELLATGRELSEFKLKKVFKAA